MLFISIILLVACDNHAAKSSSALPDGDFDPDNKENTIETEQDSHVDSDGDREFGNDRDENERDDGESPDADRHEASPHPSDGDSDSFDQDVVEWDDESEPACENPQTYYRDQDQDGYGNPDDFESHCELTPGYVEDNTDCHDDDPTAYPGSHEKEIPFDGIDQDCDGNDFCIDANCDAWPDLVFAQTDANGNYFTDSTVLLGDGNRFDSPAKWDIPTIGAMGVDTADFDKDGYVDFAFASVREGADSAEQASTVSLLYYGTGEGVRLDERVELPTTGCADVTAADVDGDGWVDLVFSNRYAGKPHAMPNPHDYQIDSVVYLNSAQGFSPIRKIELPTVGAARSRVADLNDDGWMDIIFANGVLQMIGDVSYVYWGSDIGWSETNRTALPSQFPEGVLVADITDNGQLDLLFTSWMCTFCEGTYLYENTANGFQPDNHATIAGANGATDAKFHDLNGDGYGDLVFANGAFGATKSYIYWGPAFSEAARTDLPVSTASEAAVTDLDLDGYADIVFASHPVGMRSEDLSVIFWGGSEGYAVEHSQNVQTDHAAAVKAIGHVLEQP